MYSSNASRRRELLNACESDAQHTEINRLCRGDRKAKKNLKRDHKRLEEFNKKKAREAEVVETHQPDQSAVSPEIQRRIDTENGEITMLESQHCIESSKSPELPNTPEFRRRLFDNEAETVTVLEPQPDTSAIESSKKDQSTQTSEVRCSALEVGLVKETRNFGSEDCIPIPSRKPRSLSPSFGIGGEWRSYAGGGGIGFAEFCEKFPADWSDNEEETKSARRVILRPQSPEIHTVAEPTQESTQESNLVESNQIGGEADRIDSGEEYYDALAQSPYDPCVME